MFFSPAYVYLLFTILVKPSIDILGKYFLTPLTCVFRCGKIPSCDSGQKTKQPNYKN